MFVNGEEIAYRNISLAQLLEDLDYRTDRIAVEINGDIVPKRSYLEYMIKEDDRIEIVGMVGGG